jgi:hypothetical protein
MPNPEDELQISIYTLNKPIPKCGMTISTEE